MSDLGIDRAVPKEIRSKRNGVETSGTFRTPSIRLSCPKLTRLNRKPKLRSKETERRSRSFKGGVRPTSLQDSSWSGRVHPCPGS